MLTVKNENRWIALGELALVVASGFLWLRFPSQIWFLLPLVLFPGMVRILTKQWPKLRLTSIDVWTGLFLVTAAVGYWAAWQPEAAWAKFLVLLLGVVVYFVVASQPLHNSQTVFSIIVVFVTGIALYFLLTHDWIVLPADVEVINRAGVTWMGIRPYLGTTATINPNYAGGILAVFFPLLVALLFLGIKRGYIFRSLLIVAASLIVSIALLLTSSRAAWLALGLGLGFWLLWRVVWSSKVLPQLHRFQIFRLVLAMIGVLVLVALLLFPSEFFSLARATPGLDSAQTRAALFINAATLIPDFWLTGGGLNSFSGLYSEYVLDIPNLMFRYGHNLYLDLMLEQGVFGLISVMMIFLSAFVPGTGALSKVTARQGARQHFLPAALSGMVILLVHGLLDDPIYGEGGTPLLFVLPALVVSLVPKNDIAEELHDLSRQARRLARRPQFTPFISILLLIFFGLFLITFQPMLAATLADFGAVGMARIQLADFPSDKWEYKNSTEGIEQFVPIFQQAVKLDANQPTANYRLGLIAMLEKNFPKAISYFETARLVLSNHRGILKHLGYSYVWDGQIQKGYDILQIFPEVPRELEAYPTYWAGQNEPELANYAEQLAKKFMGAND